MIIMPGITSSQSFFNVLKNIEEIVEPHTANDNQTIV